MHGTCEDYRAGLRVDRAHEEADRTAGRQIACPMLLMAATQDDLDILESEGRGIRVAPVRARPCLFGLVVTRLDCRAA